MATRGIRHFSPIDGQVGLLEEQSRYISRVLYYCDSRLRSALCIFAREKNPKVRKFLSVRICKELVSLPL